MPNDVQELVNEPDSASTPRVNGGSNSRMLVTSDAPAASTNQGSTSPASRNKEVNEEVKLAHTLRFLGASTAVERENRIQMSTLQR